MTMNNIQDNYNRKKQELLELEKQVKELEKELPINKLAEYLHKNFCTWNHTDGCGWHYENGDWTAHAHAEWLKKAQELIKFISFEEVEKVVDLLIKVKAK